MTLPAPEKKTSIAPDAAFQAFLEAVPDAMVAVDAGGAIAAVNSHAAALFGYSRGELLGQAMEMLVPEGARKRHEGLRAGYAVSPHTRPMGGGLDLSARHKSGAEIPVEISLSPVNTPGGTLILAAVRDVTETRRAREELKAAKAELEQNVAARTAALLAANKALRAEIDTRALLEREVLEVGEREQQRIGRDLHDDLGQTLTAVTYLAQLLKKSCGEESASGKDAGEIGRLVSAAIDQVRGLARGLYPVELKAHGLVPALREMAAAAESKWHVPCAVQFDDPDPVKVPAASIQIYRIAQEAVTNAAKHARARKVTVRLSSAGGAVTLAVEDDGAGVSTPAHGAGMGMHIMRYRAGMIGAALEIGHRPGGGTIVSCVYRGENHG